MVSFCAPNEKEAEALEDARSTIAFYAGMQQWSYCGPPEGARMSILQAVLFALSAVLLADIDDQAACRQRCDDALAADLTACEGLREPGRPPNATDECRDDANQRHQDCIDDCND